MLRRRGKGVGRGGGRSMRSQQGYGGVVCASNTTQIQIHKLKLAI